MLSSEVPMSRPLLAVPLFALASAPAFAAGPSPADVHTFRYELRALGSPAGEAVLTLGAEKSVQGKELRPVRLEAKTAGFAAKVFKAITDATTWVDAKGLPVLGAWESETSKGRSKGSSRFDGTRLEADHTTNGKSKKVKAKLADRAVDAVSAFAWALGLDLREGESAKRPLFDGKRLFEIEVKAGKAESVTVPAGVREAVPLLVTVTRKGFERRLVYWVGKDDKVPYKLRFEYGHLGAVEALLVAMKVEKPSA
jgi:hypothetical protein